MAEVALQPVDRVEVTIVMDLFLDMLMAGQEGVGRYRPAYDFMDHPKLLAEHGFSALVRVFRDGASHAVLYDAGLSPLAVRNNLDVMDVDVTDLRGVVLSHGHADHHGGLEGFFRRYGRRRMPLLLHPDAWRERKVVLPTGYEIRMPPPSLADLESEGLEVVEERSHSVILEGMTLVSGQVARTTDYEAGFPAHFAQEEGSWKPDPWIWDDQNLVIDVRGKGLVVISGCSHAGAVNVVHNARRLTGVDRICAFIGGLHLTGGLFEPIIGRTVQDLVALAPERIVPAHCTGWRATHALAAALPSAFVQPSVGTVFTFAA